MANLIEDGWLHLGNGTDTMKLACRTIKWDTIMQPDISHYEGGMSFGYDLGVNWLMVKVSGIILSSNSDVTIFQTKLSAWQLAGTLQLSIQRKAAGTLETLDASNTIFPVLASKGYSDVTKIEGEDGETYEVGKIQFEQAGMAS